MTRSRVRFQFRLWHIFAAMLAVAIFCTAIRYQSTLAISVLLAALAAVTMRRRSPLRTNLALVLGSAAIVMLGITLGWCVLLAGPHDSPFANVTIALPCFSVVMVLGGGTVCVCSACFLVFMVQVEDTEVVEGVRKETGALSKSTITPAQATTPVAENFKPAAS